MADRCGHSFVVEGGKQRRASRKVEVVRKIDESGSYRIADAE